MKPNSASSAISEGKVIYIYFLAFLLNTCYGSGIITTDSTSDTRYDSVEDAFDDLLTDPIIDRDCSHPVCDILPQCGCPEGTMCTYLPTVGRVCASEGLKEEGDVCTTSLECRSGLLCEVGVCRRACYENVDCSNSDACYLDVEGDDISVCNVQCHLVYGEECPAGYKCGPLRVEGIEDRISDCIVQLGHSMQFETCEMDHAGSADCAQGYICGTDGESEYCVAICSTFEVRDPHCPEELPCCINDPIFIINDTEYRACGAISPTGVCESL